jgi:hypothetical protein
MSYILHLISWKKATEFYARTELEAKLMIRDDYHSLRQDPGDFVTIRHYQRFAINEYQEIARTHSLEDLLVSYDIWEKLPNYLKNRNIMGYSIFSLALNKDAFYANSLMRYGLRWIGLRFHFPIIWCPTWFYKAPIKLEEHDERTQWLQMGRKHWATTIMENMRTQPSL